jgi:signal peptidase I
MKTKITYKTIVLCVVLTILCFLTFIFDIGLGKVVGPSMAPTLVTGDIAILAGRLNIDRFDIVEIEYDDCNLIKRVIGLPGETIIINEGNLYIDLQHIYEPYVVLPDFYEKHVVVLGKDQYYVMGDNRINSHDSRTFGPVNKESIIRELIITIGCFR